jgi:hypothetical protein
MSDGTAFKQGVHQNDVDHRTLVDDECVTLQRVLVVALVALGRVELQQPVDGLGFHARSLGHALGGTAGRCGKEDVESHLFESGNDAVLGGRLAGTGTAREHHDLVVDSSADGLRLKVIVGDAGLLADGSDVWLLLEHILLTVGQERLKLVGGAHLTEIERRKVDRLVLNLQVLIRYHLVKRGLDSGLLGFQQFHTGIHELVTVGIDVALVGKLVEGVEDTAAATALVVLAIAHLLCDGVGGLEADAPDVVGKTVGVGLHLVDALLAVGLVYLGGIGGTDTVSLEEDHHVLDVELLHP